jgi:hypothetical protein
MEGWRDGVSERKKDCERVRERVAEWQRLGSGGAGSIWMSVKRNIKT